MKRKWKKYLLVLPFLFFLLAIPRPAFAAGCSGPSCEGLNPHALGCDLDASRYGYTELKAGDTVYGYVVLLYSPICNANWSKVVSNIATTGGASVVHAGPNESNQTSTYPNFDAANDYAIWSPMTNGTGLVQACGTINLYSSPPTGWVTPITNCTPYF